MTKHNVNFVLSLILIGMITPVFAQEPSFDDQLMNSTEYSKIIDRLYELEQNDLPVFEILLIVGTFSAFLVAFWGNHRAGKQLEKQNKISKQQIEYQGILEIMKIFNNDENGRKRDKIYEKNRHGTLYKDNGEFLDDETRFYVASVRGTFDNMGKLVHDNYVNKEQFLSMYCGSVIRMFKVLRPHIEFERKDRPSQHFAVYFEEIFNDSRKYWSENFSDDPEPEPY